MLERAIKEARDQTTPPETLIQLLSFVGHSVLAIRICAERKLKAGIPTQSITINNFRLSEAEHCRSFTVNAHLWGDILPTSVERDQLASFVWVEDELLELFSLTVPTQRFQAIENSLVGVLHAIAENPSTPPPLLKRLFNLSSLRVKDAATENPNAPLMELFSHDRNTGVNPERLMRNPAFPLLLVEHPDFFQKIPGWLAESFIRIPSCTVEILQSLSEHTSRWVQSAIIEHPLVTPAMLEKLSASEVSDVRVSVAKHPATQAETLLRLAKESDVRAHRSLAKNPNTPEEGLALLAQSTDGRTKEALAQNPNISGDLLDVLVKSNSLPILRFVLAHPNVSPKTLHSLAQDRRKAVLLLLAKHPKLLPETCELLAKNDGWQILRELKSNPATPKALLERLLTATTKKR